MRVLDKAARWVITFGGIGAIGAVCLVCLFLVWMVVPLFLPASVEDQSSAPTPPQPAAPLRTGINETKSLMWTLAEDGRLSVVSLDDGHVISSQPLLDQRTITAVSSPASEGVLALGFADGAIQAMRISFKAQFLSPQEVPEDAARLGIGGHTIMDQGVVQRISDTQFRYETVAADLEEPVATRPDVPVVLLDYIETLNGPFLAVLHADGELLIEQIRRQTNMLTGQVTLKQATSTVPFTLKRDNPPSHLLIGSAGRQLMVAWDDGRLMRFDARNFNSPVLAETVDLVPEDGEKLTGTQFLIGRSTLLAGDTLGRVRAWFAARQEGAEAPDGMALVAGHTLELSDQPITHLAASDRARLAAAADARGRVHLFNVTTEKRILKAGVAQDQAPPGIQVLAMAPKNDGLVAVMPGQIMRWDLDPRHHEASLSALFLPVWYEGAREPEQVWQSSSGTDSYEPKFGMIPLIVGTLKATFYSLIFGAPLALLAAIYTSEFLHPKMKGRIKPTIELMASLPSVVLGFLAALVFAPMVESVLPTVLAAFATLPLAFVMGGYVWQLMPRTVGLRLQRIRFILILLLMPVGVLAAVVAGPFVEDLLFSGDLMLWLDGQIGSPLGGWLMLFLPLAGVLVLFIYATTASAWVRARTAPMNRLACALADLAVFVTLLAAIAGLSLAMAAVFTQFGWDLRGSFLDTYVQRNALVVGFVMGFAIIPIIFTIAEDALSTVPEHLRSASLAAGATPWQTAARIVIPTAMSGLFSALIIGLGRAVGETMIVLMAAGNTPIMDFNIFNGFRTLSANIAVELPEAVRNSTHYRTLFLAALVLFAMTSVLNTGAEIVRLKFRKRASQL